MVQVHLEAEEDNSLSRGSGQILGERVKSPSNPSGVQSWVLVLRAGVKGRTKNPNHKQRRHLGKWHIQPCPAAF